MSDLIERLRRVDSATQNMSNSVTTNWLRNPDGPEAADEIERLRAERDEAVALLREESHEHYRFTQMTEYPSVTRMLLWNMDRKRRIDAFLAKVKP